MAKPEDTLTAAAATTSSPEQHDSPDNDFVGGKAGDADDASSDSGASSDDDEEEGGHDAGRATKRARSVNLEDDEAQALLADLGQDVRQGKRIRSKATEEEEKDAVKATTPTAGPSSQSNEVWKAMQSGSTSSATEVAAPATVEEPLVRVKQTFRFAGQEVTEEKMLPASHPDAKKHLATVEAAASTAATALPTSSAARPLPGPPRRRKAGGGGGGGLAAMSAAATAKPAKLNTLEKSKMDWTKYKDTTLNDNQRHELDAQTTGGASGLGTMKGYMERRNFLERVQGRLDGPQEKGGGGGGGGS